MQLERCRSISLIDRSMIRYKVNLRGAQKYDHRASRPLIELVMNFIIWHQHHVAQNIAFRLNPSSSKFKSENRLAFSLTEATWKVEDSQPIEWMFDSYQRRQRHQVVIIVTETKYPLLCSCRLCALLHWSWTAHSCLRSYQAINFITLHCPALRWLADWLDRAVRCWWRDVSRRT